MPNIIKISQLDTANSIQSTDKFELSRVNGPSTWISRSVTAGTLAGYIESVIQTTDTFPVSASPTEVQATKGDLAVSTLKTWIWTGTEWQLISTRPASAIWDSVSGMIQSIGIESVTNLSAGAFEVVFDIVVETPYIIQSTAFGGSGPLLISPGVQTDQSFEFETWHPVSGIQNPDQVWIQAWV